jgi:predicted nucleic acid-binding Zn ribbon protein
MGKLCRKAAAMVEIDADEGAASGKKERQDATTATRSALNRMIAGARQQRPGKNWEGTKATGRDPALVGQIVEEIIQADGWKEELVGGTIVTRWELIVGSAMAAHSAVLSCDEGQLVIEADSASWAREIRLLLPQVEANLAREVGPGAVKQIKVVGPGRPVGRTYSGPRRVRSGKRPDSY